MTSNNGTGATAAPTITAWAIKAPDGQLYFMTKFAGFHRLSNKKPKLVAGGYPCVRVQIQEVQG